MKMASTTSNVSSGPGDLETQWQIDWGTYTDDSAAMSYWKAQVQAQLATLEAMIKEKKDPSKILNYFWNVMNPTWEKRSYAKQNVLTSNSQLNTDIRNFGASSLALTDKANQVDDKGFVDMIQELQLMATHVQEPVFGDTGKEMLDEINSIAQLFNGDPHLANKINTIFDINSSNIAECESYFKAQTAPVPLPPSGTAPVTPPSPAPVPSQLLNSWIQSAGVNNQDVSSLSAPLQTEVQYEINVAQQMLSMYTNGLKSTQSLWKTINKNNT